MMYEVDEQLRNHMLDFMKLYYDGEINHLHEYSDLDPDRVRYHKLKYLTEWYDLYKSEDFEVLFNTGISLDLLNDLKSKFNQLYDIFFLPAYKKKNSSFNLFSIIYYKFNIQNIKKSCDEMRTSLKSYSGSFNEAYFINHENFKVNNLFKTIPDTLNEIDELLIAINENFEKISFDNDFVFTSHFSILKNFITSIQNKSFTPDEYNELTYNWSVLFLKGFALSQINVKLTSEENSEKKVKFSDIEYEQYCNLCWRIQFSKLIMTKIDINEKYLNQLFQKYSNTNLRGILAPFIQILIPHYKALMRPESYIRLTIDQSKEYEKFMNKIKYTSQQIKKLKDKGYESQRISDEFLQFDKFVCGLYLDEIPFVLTNSPGDSYMKLFRICLRRFNYTCFESEIISKSPCEELFSLDEISNLDDLMNQKYFIVDSIVKNIVHVQKINDYFFTYVNTNSAALFLSLLPWKIDRQSVEARELEERIMQNVRFTVNNSPMQSLFYDKIRKYIIKNVWNAKKPLDIEKMKSKVNPYIDESCNIY